MTLHLISFAFWRQTPQHAALLEAIQAIGPAVQLLATQWLLISRRSRAEIVGELAPYIDDRDCLIVASIDPSKLASYNLPESVTQWLASSMQRLRVEAARNLSSPPTSTVTTSRGVSAAFRDFPD